MKKKITLVLFVAMILCCLFSIEVHADSYAYRYGGNEYSDLNALASVKPSSHKDYINAEVYLSGTKVGDIAVVNLQGDTYFMTEVDAKKIKNGEYDNAFLVYDNTKLVKVSSASKSGSESMDSLMTSKTAHMASAFDSFTQPSNVDKPWTLSNDLGVSSTVNGSATGLAWWGVNSDRILDIGYQQSNMLSLQTVKISTFVEFSTLSDKADYNLLLLPGQLNTSQGMISINQDAIKATVEFVFNESWGYKYRVKKALLEISIEYGINVYSLKADKPVKLKDCIDTSGGDRKIAVKNGISESLNYFIHPGFGIMNSPPTDAAGWLDTQMFQRLTNISDTGAKLNPDLPLGFMSAQKNDGSASGTVVVKLSEAYKNFVTSKSTYYGNLTPVTGNPTGGVNPIRSGASSTHMQHYSDNLMRVVLPAGFAVDTSNKYSLSSQGYRYFSFADYYYDVKANDLYARKEDGSYASVADVSDFGLTDDDIYIHKASLPDMNGYGNDGEGGGVFVFTKVYEAITKPTGASSTETVFTGRTVKFDLTASGTSLQSKSNFVQTLDWGKDTGKNAALQDYAFPKVATAFYDLDSHVPIEGKTDARAFYTILRVETNKPEYFAIVRNNAYVQDSDFTSWIKGAEIQSSPAPYELIRRWLAGGLGKEELSYEDWVRLEEIRKELEENKKTGWLSFITVPTIIFGVLLILYGILLVVAYWIDVFNNFGDFSFLHYLTFKKVYPVMNEEDKQYANCASTNVKYVTKKWVFTTFAICVIIGALFISYMDLLQLLLNVYLWVINTIGGAF